VPISCLPQTCRLPRDLFRLSGTCPWLVSHGVFGRSSGMDGWIEKDFSNPCVFWRLNAEFPGRGARELCLCVRKGGLEPPRPKAQEPKSCVSANFTTRAWQLTFVPLRPACWTGSKNVRRRMPGSIVASAGCPSCQPRRCGVVPGRYCGKVSRYASSLRSRRSFATCPVARTLYWAKVTLPSGSITTVERMSPS
jgi:hypothetical protein